VFAVEILRDVAHTLKRNGEQFVHHQRLNQSKSEQFANELQSISTRADTAIPELKDIQENSNERDDLLKDVLHISGFLNTVSFSLSEQSKEYGKFLDTFEQKLEDVVAKMELSFAQKLNGVFDAHQKVFNQLTPIREKLSKLRQLSPDVQDSPGKMKEIDRYAILEAKRESQLTGMTRLLLERCQNFVKEHEPRVRCAIFSYKVAEYDTYVAMADSIKKIASEREDGIDELRKIVEQYEDQGKNAFVVPRLLNSERKENSVQEPLTPEERGPVSRSMKFEGEDEEEEEKENQDEAMKETTP